MTIRKPLMETIRFLLFQKLNILLVLLFYITNVAIASPQSITEHTIDIHIPIAIPLDNVPTQANTINPTTSKYSVNNIYDQFSSDSDFNYSKSNKHKNRTSESHAHDDQTRQETSKKVGAEYLDKGKLHFRKINKHVDVDVQKIKTQSSNAHSQTNHTDLLSVRDPTYEIESQKTKSRDSFRNSDIIKVNNSQEIAKTKDDALGNNTKTKDKWKEKKHERNIINVLRTRKVRKSHHLDDHDHNKVVQGISNEFTYPEVSPVYIPNNDNHTDENKINESHSKRIAHNKSKNITSTNPKVHHSMTTSKLYDENSAGEKIVPSTNYPRHFKQNFESTHEVKNKRKSNSRREQSRKNVELNHTSSTSGFKEKSSDSVLEPYDPIVFRYEDYPFQSQNFSRNNFSNTLRYYSYQQNSQNRRQQEYENLLANDAKQQSDDYHGIKTKKHGKRGFKIISDLINLVTGNNGPPPKRYRAHIIGSDGYAFENNPFGSSQALTLSSQGLTLNNPFTSTNGNNHNFGLTAFGNSKDFGQSFSFGSDGSSGHSLSLVNGNQGFGTTGSDNSQQKISFGTSANGDTFAFANIKDPKSQVESVFSSGNSLSNGGTGASEKVRIVTKEVPVPYPVHVEKKVPYFIRVPHDRAVPYPVHKPYPVHITKPVPYPVKVHVPAPYPVTVEKHVPFPVKVSVPRPIAIHIPKPYPVYIEKKVPITVEKHVPYPVKVPVEKPVPVHIAVEKPVPYAVTKHVPYPVKVPVEKPYPLTIPKPYPITIEKPVKVPYKVPVPISINFPGKNEQFTTGIDHSSNTGGTTAFGANAGGSTDFGANTGGTTAFGANVADNNQAINHESFGNNQNNAQQNNFPTQFYNQENTNNGNADFDGNSEGSFDYGDPGNLGFGNGENTQSGFGNTGGGFDSQNNFGNQGNIQADIPNINTIKVPEVNQNYQIYFDGNRQHKHKQTQDIFNEVNTVFDNLENKAVVPNFDQVGNIQNGRQLQNNVGRAMKQLKLAQTGMRGSTRFPEAHTERNSREHNSPSVGNNGNHFNTSPNENHYNSHESSHYPSGETNTNGQSQYPSSQEYTKIDYTLLGGSFESHQSESENHSS